MCRIMRPSVTTNLCLSRRRASHITFWSCSAFSMGACPAHWPSAYDCRHVKLTHLYENL